MDINISIVVPVYNGAESLFELHQRIKIVLESLSLSYEIILINDNSKDNSLSVMKSLNQQDPRVKIISLMKNFGQHNAIMCGFNHAEGNYIVTMDDDLQNPPEEIPRLLAKVQEGYDVVIGKPLEKKHAAYKNFGSFLIGKSFEKIFKKPKSLKMSSFRILHRSIVQNIIQSKTPNPMIDALILSNTLNIINVEVRHDERKFGNSGYSISKSVKLAFDLLINYSTIPLRFITLNGFFFAIIGLMVAIYVVLGKIFGTISITGWASTIALISIFSGLTLMSFGIVGEYLARIIGEVSSFKQYVIKESSYDQDYI
ncbi:glycosyltransferase family 2 protein [Paenibacillus mesophilus]|uniref:glycosyltransferase family 2 protein n=1 Tax=Paenibacillus mesophilus TaxID=2582849 RepID=UPI00110D35C8|nr:glycosyltransferase family 2 protein [Paenibacillus mesophilus]TMV50797.1 glycosyltransferase family 2 protein [Paenibacillus mesophilus]